MKTTKIKVKCSVEGCLADSRSRGVCAKHYRRWLRTGSTDDKVALTCTPKRVALTCTPKKIGCIEKIKKYLKIMLDKLQNVC